MDLKNEKISFILYGSYEEQINMLTDEQAGKLIKSVYSYMRTGEKHTDDPLVNMLLSVISHQLDIDARKYAEKKERLKEAGRKGGIQKAKNLAKASMAGANIAERSDAKNIVANLAVNDNEDVNVCEDVDVLDNLSDDGGAVVEDTRTCEIVFFTENQYPTIQQEIDKFQAFAEKLFVRYGHRQPGMYDLQQVFEYTHSRELLDDTVAIAKMDVQKAELLEYVFTLAANADKVNWSYIHGIYQRFAKRNIKTVYDAEQYDWNLRYGMGVSA